MFEENYPEGLKRVFLIKGNLAVHVCYVCVSLSSGIFLVDYLLWMKVAA